MVSNAQFYLVYAYTVTACRHWRTYCWEETVVIETVNMTANSNSARAIGASDLLW